MRSQGTVKTCLEFGFFNLYCQQVELAHQCIMERSVLDLDVLLFTGMFSSLSVVLTGWAPVVLSDWMKSDHVNRLVEDIYLLH